MVRTVEITRPGEPPPPRGTPETTLAREQRARAVPERPLESRRRGHRREYDGRRPRRSLERRLDGVVRDVGAFRAVALPDLIAQQFDGHPFAAQRGARTGGTGGLDHAPVSAWPTGRDVHSRRGHTSRGRPGGGALA